jgi:membrane protein
MLRFFSLFRKAVWSAFRHDAFGVAKGAAYSSILTMFPALMLSASILISFAKTQAFIHEISNAVGRVMPPGTASTAETYFQTTHDRPIRIVVLASIITLWTASGVIISWMEGFRNAYRLPKMWGVIKERMIAFGLVIMAGIPMFFATALVAFGNEIEQRLAEGMMLQLGHEVEPYILTLWTLTRWVIAVLTLNAVMALIYHHAVPRTQPWHSVLPGSVLVTALWFPATIGFRVYVRHFAQYSLFYGSLATAVVLLVWLYIISVIVLVGAEFNAILYPRAVAGGGSSGERKVAS